MSRSRPVQGEPLRVWTNSYEISRRPTTTYYHYDAITPPLFNSRRAHEVISKLQIDNPHIFNPRAAYDGRANLFSKGNINTGEYTVHMSRNPTATKGVFVVRLTRVAAIRPADIDQLIAAGGAGRTANTMAVNLLQIIVRQAANMRHGFSPEARSFFIDRGAKDLAGGLQAWHGYFQSVRPVLGRLLINVDVANAVVYAPGPVETLAMKFLGMRNVRDLERLQPGTPDWMKLKSFLKNVLVTTVMARSTKSRPIKDIVQAAGRYEFEKDGMTTTVQDHFRQHHNIRLRYPTIFGVRIGKFAVFPAEVCIVTPGQLYKKKLSPENTTLFLKFSTQKPDERLRTIKDGVAGPQQVLDYNSSDFMQEAGMAVQPQPIEINGRVLRTPQIKYGSGPVQIRPRAGAWNVLGQRLIQCGQINYWAVAVFDSSADPARVGQFVTTLRGNLTRLGLTITSNPLIESCNPYQVKESLDGLGLRSVANAPGPQKPLPNLILVILPNSAADIRRNVKSWGDTVRGVATQCVRQGKWEAIKDQYCNNVALKINAKIGGVNSSITSAILPPGAMVIGADVGHPGPGVMNRPSITSLVASVDQDATRFTTYAAVQEPRVEIIKDLKKMIRAAIRDFALYWRGKYPTTIVFYRDGVSEGEYAQVAAQEVAAINEALLEFGTVDPSGNISQQMVWNTATKPKVIFIVVGKRHHIRFFPMERQHADNSGNCPPGFVVDDQITNATYPDFYLQSHSGIQGTSRPSHYIVIENEVGLDVDKIQELSFSLCHVYQSATRSVSIPAPVYYADRVCARAEFHFDERLHFADSDAATTASNRDRDAPFPLADWQNGFRQPIMGKTMYFL